MAHALKIQSILFYLLYEFLFVLVAQTLVITKRSVVTFWGVLISDLQICAQKNLLFPWKINFILASKVFNNPTSAILF